MTTICSLCRKSFIAVLPIAAAAAHVVEIGLVVVQVVAAPTSERSPILWASKLSPYRAHIGLASIATVALLVAYNIATFSIGRDGRQTIKKKSSSKSKKQK